MHHKLDIEPIPEKVLYINEPWLFDESIVYTSQIHVEPDNEEDNIRVYLPLDLNRKAILRRLDAQWRQPKKLGLTSFLFVLT